MRGRHRMVTGRRIIAGDNWADKPDCERIYAIQECAMNAIDRTHTISVIE